MTRMWEEWEEVGCSSLEEAHDWLIYRFLPAGAKPWIEHDFSPQEAATWQQYGFIPERANEWRRLNLPPIVARIVTDLF